MLKNRIYYLGLFILASWLMIMYEGVFVEGMFAVTFIVPIALIIIKYITRFGIKGYWMAQTLEIDAGNEINISSVIYNNTIFPVNRVEIRFQVKDLAGNTEKYTMVTNLMPEMKRKCTMKIKPNFSGVVEVQLKSIKIFDWLGLTSTTKKKGSMLKMVVYPKNTGALPVVLNEKGLIAEEGEYYSDVIPGTDRSEVFDIADYHEGNNIRDIHWKLSLKTDEYIVKRYGMPVCNEINLFIDTAIDRKRKCTAKGIDKFFSCIFALIDGLEENNEKVNLYIFDRYSDNIYRTDRKGVMSECDAPARSVGEICNIFIDNVTEGRNILISSRINEENISTMEELASYYTNIDVRNINEEDIVIEKTKILGVSIDENEKDDMPSVELGNDMHINSDEEDIGIYTNILRLILVIMGTYSSLAILFDTIVVYNSNTNLLITTTISVLAMFISTFIKKKKFKIPYIMAVMLIMAIFLGINDIVAGINGVISSIGQPVNIESISENTGVVHYEIGIIYGLEYETGRLFAFIAVIVSMLMFSCTWKRIVLSGHFLLTLPMVLFCFANGCVPSGIEHILFVAYFFGLLVYRVTYSNIIKNENGILKKAFYESTLNIGAIMSYILIILAAIIMIADWSKGYDRSEKLTEIKQQVNAFFEEVDLKRIFTKKASGGMNKGKLGEYEELEFSGKTMLNVSVEGDVQFPLYIKGFVGSEYNGDRWEEVYDAISGLIRDRLGENDITLTDAYNIPYYLLALENMGGTSMTIEKVKHAEVTITTEDGSDKTCYIPYGAYYKYITIKKEGVLPENDRSKLNYDVYQITRVDNIVRDNKKEIYQAKEVAYSEAIQGMYTGDSYLDSVDAAILNEVPWTYNYEGERINLRGGVELNGYEVYIECIKSYLNDNYTYSLSPGKLETGEDFVIKFMKDKEGYCSHFASLATLMFRAYGIPARYVEGYYVYPDSDEYIQYKEYGQTDIKVTDESAHAWTEIYIEGYGWMPIEVTPDYAGLNYHQIEEKVTEQPSKSEQNTADRETTTTHQQQTSTKKNEQNTTGIQRQDNGDEYVSSVKIDGKKLGTWIIIISAVSFVSIILGRKSSKDRKREIVMGGRDYSAAARQWETELIYTIESTRIPVNVNAERRVLSSQLEKYIKLMVSVKKRKHISVKKLHEKLERMYDIFDRASYSDCMISKEEMKEAASTAGKVIYSLYLLQKPHNKLILRYIKCLYLKRK